MTGIIKPRAFVYLTHILTLDFFFFGILFNNPMAIVFFNKDTFLIHLPLTLWKYVILNTNSKSYQLFGCKTEYNLKLCLAHRLYKNRVSDYDVIHCRHNESVLSL